MTDLRSFLATKKSFNTRKGGKQAASSKTEICVDHVVFLIPGINYLRLAHSSSAVV